MTDAQDILSGRLAQAQGILSSLLIDEQHDNMVSRELNHTLWAVDTLLEQAAEALKEMPYVSKPDAPVRIDRVDLCRTLNEALSMADHSIDLIQCVRADLAGKPRPPLGKEPEKVLP